jgi:hypothetical protein
MPFFNKKKITIAQIVNMIFLKRFSEAEEKNINTYVITIVIECINFDNLSIFHILSDTV